MRVKGQLYSSGSIFLSVLFVTAILSGCATTKQSKINEYGYLMFPEREHIRELVAEKKYDKAKNEIDSILQKNADLKPAPYVKDSTLYYYSNNRVATLAYLIGAASMIVKDSTSKKKMKWNKAVVVEPVVPDCYFDLAYIDNDRQNYYAGIENLKKAIYYWPDDMMAYAEMAYTYIRLNDYQTAHKYVDSALARPNAYLFPIGLAAVYRRLGYMEIDEGKLDSAEAHYKTSIKLFDHPAARKDLEYIKSLRQQH